MLTATARDDTIRQCVFNAAYTRTKRSLAQLSARPVARSVYMRRSSQNEQPLTQPSEQLVAPTVAASHLVMSINSAPPLIFAQLHMCHNDREWAPNASDLQRLRRNDRAMIRWICGAKLEDEISAVLHQKLDLDEITAVLRTRRLRWYGHIQRATSCINSIT